MDEKRTGLSNAFFLRLALVFAACVTVQPMAAQSTQGSILGNVTDATGAVIAGVTVKVTNADTGIEREVSSDELGYYDAVHLEVGVFRVTADTRASRPSFAKKFIWIQPEGPD